MDMVSVVMVVFFYSGANVYIQTYGALTFCSVVVF